MANGVAQQVGDGTLQKVRLGEHDEFDRHLLSDFRTLDLFAPRGACNHLREGRGLQVIELNGVSAEATHIYDPGVSVWEAYRVMFRHWRLAFTIGRRNVELGARAMTVRELATLVWKRSR